MNSVIAALPLFAHCEANVEFLAFIGLGRTGACAKGDGEADRKGLRGA